MVRRTIKPKTLEEKFIQSRNDKHISLDEASRDLNIPFKYLESLEHGKFNDLPDKEYIRNSLEKYCDYLKIDFDDCWSEAKLRPNFPSIKIIGDINRKYFMSWPRLLRRIVIWVMVATVLVFLFTKVEQIFTPPDLKISYPIDGLVIASKQITIIGKSESEVELIVNNKEIFVDSDGNFEAVIDLQKGLNLIKITAKKRYSRVQEKEIRLLFKD